MKRTLLHMFIVCALSSVFSGAAFADTVYYACITKSGSYSRISLTPIHCPPGEFLISGGQTAAYAGGLIGTTNIQQCNQQGLASCQQKMVTTLGLVEGQQMILNYLPSNSSNPQTPQVVDQMVITKQSGPTGTPTDFSVNFVVTTGGIVTPYQFQISPSVPVYATASDTTCAMNPSACPVNVVATLLTDSLVSIETGVGQVYVVTNESEGLIKSATLTYYKGASEGTLTVVIWNVGQYTANYITTAQIAGVIPVPAQSQTLDSQATKTLTFKLQAISGPFGSGNTGKVTLWSPDGTQYYYTSVTPVEIAEPQK